MKKLNEKGTSLIEALVALSIAVVIIGAIAAAVIFSLNNTSQSKLENQARTLAQQSMEYLSQLADSDYATFTSSYTGGNIYCMDGNQQITTDNTANPCRSLPNLPGFARQFQVQRNPSSASCYPNPAPTPASERNNYAQATVIVSWTDSKCPSGTANYCHNVSLQSCFTNNENNINAIPSPI